MKKLIFTASALLLGVSGFTQTLQDAITKTNNESFELAAADLQALIKQQPTNGVNYFYLGENSFNNEDIEGANASYLKGIEVNATYPLNYVGLGKVLLFNGKVEEANKQFFQAKTLGPKNAEVFRKIAEAWLVTDNKNADEAINLLNTAIKLDPKNAENYILLGDAQFTKNPADGSTPIKNYQKASELNPKSPKGILREGRLYEGGRNYNLALEKYKAALALEPNFAPAYREIAELYSKAGKQKESIENWKKYLEMNNKNDARYLYMNSLFKNKQYADAITEYGTLKNNGFNKPIMERLAAYSYYEMGNKTDSMAYIKGLEAINKFFGSVTPDFKFLASDYEYKGLLLIRTGKETEGLSEIDKGIALDAGVCSDAYTKLTKIATEKKDYAKAIAYTERKQSCVNPNFINTDYFDIGKAYYFYANEKERSLNELKTALTKAKKPLTTIEIKQKEDSILDLRTKADTAFKNLTKLNPNWEVGYQWRGRVNSMIDYKVELDTTKVIYEKVISLVKAAEEKGAKANKAAQIEALEYLGYYYVTKKDKTNADLMFNQLKEIDPNNEKAKNYFAPPKPAKAAGAK